MESSGAASCSSPSSLCRISSRRDCVGCSTATGSAPSRGSSRGWDSSPSPSSRALFLAGGFRISRRLNLDRDPRRAARHLHRGWALLGPHTEARCTRGPGTDFETVTSRKENATSRGREAPQGQTYWDSSTPPGGMYRLPHSQDQIAASFPPASSILVTL